MKRGFYIGDSSLVRVGLLGAALLVLGLASGAAAEHDRSYSLALDSIKVENLKTHVQFLADDKRQGREAGTAGGRASGDYVAKQFADDRLEPLDKNGYFQPFSSGYRNVLGSLPGSDPKLKKQVVIVGAHYDHVGYGTPRNSRGPVGQVHNGADDNASGASALLELAEAFSLLEHRPRRTLLFVGWDAEEKGLLGSKYWTAHPTVPIENVAFVFNMDMIGRLRNNTVQVFGSRSTYGLRRLLAENNRGFDLAFDWTTKPNADYWPLFDQKIPYLMLHTGKHREYHTPYDDMELINHVGMRRLTRFLFTTVYAVADAEETPAFREAARREDNYMRRQLASRAGPATPRLGVRWREEAGGSLGVQLTSVDAGTPADAARLRPGDRIVRLGEQKIDSGETLQRAVFYASGPTPLTVKRRGEVKPRKITAELPKQPLRVGVAWRVDPAAPHAVVLTRVVPGSPADRAGIRPGDRVYQVNGKNFADEQEFTKRLAAPSDAIELLIDRHGRLETMVLRFAAVPIKRAA